jgi:tRNA A37 threonylcarbamoyladenosine biosynthesis protein TsaE
LDSAGILENEISEDLNDKSKIVIVEWGGVVDGVLPVDRLTIKIISPTENSREVSLSSAGESSSILLKGLSV